MRRIKGRSASKLFGEFPKLKQRYRERHFWARGYFCSVGPSGPGGCPYYAIVGQVTEEMIKSYLEHHFKPTRDDTFETEG